MNTMISFAGACCAAVLLVLFSSVPSNSVEEDVFRKLLESGGGSGGEKPPTRPKTTKPSKPAAPKEDCAQQFTALKTTVDARDERHKKTCFFEERCTWADKCAYSKTVHYEYGRLAKMASNCRSLADNQTWADKYAKWAAAGDEVIRYNCQPR